ncbi:ABC-type multidrug transport system, ATPase component [Saccharicrinis carchari]|uniref:ABC-type multidrug transport system, ATPase component n=1 Tax=Saccharicrinis carchari TaxID=1168039 RepID=A0A521BW77_SACCC|nr:ATP-binding cassette domain-containing protein [Saccharicrinis carchari]SMO50871.1 ABC-type multidrug transport system, ATPase component [Saccharicrinis carchari]
MSETLLDALMKLYALLTNVRKESRLDSARSLIEQELLRNFNKEYVDQYLQRFNFYIQSFHKYTYSPIRSEVEQQSSDNYDQLYSICDELNKELERESKIWLFVQLLEFMRKEEKTSTIANEVIDKLSIGMMIDPVDYALLKTFILVDPKEVSDPQKVLVISGQEEPPLPNFKHLYNPKQQVFVWILYIQSTNTFIFRYSGDRNLYLNGHKVERNNAYILSVGSVIKTSRMPPVYYGKVSEVFVQKKESGRIMLKARDVVYKFNDKQIGIHAFSFTGRSGQLVGIMGGSGTGKSTLLNVLNGSYRMSSGSIHINGLDIHEQKEALKGVIGHVPQEDLLIEELTVFENLYFNAELCFSDFTKPEIVSLVESALKDFDLVEARDMVVGSPLNKTLSGGQRKRLNIALELMREPSILFVDEPTSGLSSMDSEKVMALLKRQTLKGRLVILNIHQPSSDIYKMLDKLLIIDKGGYIIYNGNPMDAIVYFKQQANYVNPEDSECYLCGSVKVEQPLSIIEARMVNPDGRLIRKRKTKPVEWYHQYQNEIEQKFEWKKTDQPDEVEPLPPNLYNIPNRLRQFVIYTLRGSLSKYKDRQYMLITFLEAPILALILGLFTKFMAGTASDPNQYIFSQNDNIPAYLFMAVTVALFLGLNVSAEEIIKDRKLLQREKFLNLSRFSYLNSKITILFFISAIQTLSFVLIGNYILEIKGLNPSYWMILFSAACFSNMLGLNISSGIKSVVSIYILIPLILIPQLLFSGVIVNFDKLHNSIQTKDYVPRIADMMTSRWAYEALAVNQFAENRYERNFFEDDQTISESSYYYSLLIPALKQHNARINSLLMENKTEEAQAHRSIIETELTKMDKDLSADFKHAPYQGELPDESYTKQTELLLDSLAIIYQNKYKEARSNKDATYKQLANNMGGADALFKLKQQYHNNSLAAQLLNKTELKHLVLMDGEYIPKKDPVLRDGTSDWGRAHFFAPTKKFAGITIPTPFFNMLVIWFSTWLLYVTLYLDVLRRIIIYFEKFRLKRRFRIHLSKV